MALMDPTPTNVAQELRDAILTGRLVDRRTGDAEADDPGQGAGWVGQRTVAATLLEELLTSTEGPRRPRALRLAGARIIGQLNLQAAELACPLLLHGCWFDEPVILTEAQAVSVELSGCRFPALQANQLVTRGNVHLTEVVTQGQVGLFGAHIGGDLGFNRAKVEGQVGLFGAHIKGGLSFNGANLSTPYGGFTLFAHGLIVDKDMVCSMSITDQGEVGFSVRGEIILLNARIGGALILEGANLTNPSGFALYADGLTVDQGMSCRKLFTTKGEVRFTTEGQVSLVGAHIGGSLNLDGAALANPGGPALRAANVRVDQDLSCGGGFTAEGEVSLVGGHVGGNLDLSEATLNNPEGRALFADGLTVGRLIRCDRLTAQGEIRLVAAHVSDIGFEGAMLTNPAGRALDANRLTVEQSMFCRNGFTGKGEVHLRGAHIGGVLKLNGATLINPSGLALGADRLTVKEGMYCSDGFTAEGEVDLRGAQIGGNLDFSGATLTNPDKLALNLEAVHVGTLILRAAIAPDRVDLADAKVGVLNDDPDTWPSKLRLVGFAYDVLAERKAITAKQRLGWLGRDPDGYSPQPYEQLAAFYRRAGREEDVRRVAIAKQRRRRGKLRLPGRLWSLLLDGLVGYGYRTWLAGVWLAGFWLVGWVVFARAHAHHDLILAKPDEVHPGFHPAVYALDTLLPVVDLHQQDTWIPRGVAQWWAWVSILAGWVLTTAVVAALTGLLKRD